MDGNASGSKRGREPEVFLYDGEESAEELWDRRDDITRVRIGPRVEEIPRGAFRDFTNLTEVEFDDEGALQVIGEGAFVRCTSLRCMTLPPGVTKLSESAFKECYNLAELNLNDGLQTIGADAFGYCENLKSVTLPLTVTRLGEYAFSNCHNLVELLLNEGLQCIGELAFLRCTSLRSVTIPSTVLELGERAFQECKNLANVQISEGVQTIGDCAFGFCKALRSVTLPSTVRRVGELAFYYCSNLAEVIFLGGEHFLNHDFLVRRLSDGEGILKQDMIDVLTSDGRAFSFSPLNGVKLSIAWAVSERIACLPLEHRLSIEDRIRKLPRLGIVSDKNVMAYFPLVRRDPDADDDSDSEEEEEEEEWLDIKDANNETAGSVYLALQLIAFYELKESSILIELAMWKSRIVGDRSRADCRVAIPGPAKSLIMEYCGFAGFLRPAVDCA